jgi:hypothetical protein
VHAGYLQAESTEGDEETEIITHQRVYRKAGGRQCPSEAMNRNALGDATPGWTINVSQLAVILYKTLFSDENIINTISSLLFKNPTNWL